MHSKVLVNLQSNRTALAFTLSIHLRIESSHNSSHGEMSEIAISFLLLNFELRTAKDDDSYTTLIERTEVVSLFFFVVEIFRYNLPGP